MKYRIFNDEVLYTVEAVTRVGPDDLARLTKLAAENPRQRIRLCAHPDVGDPLHEMIIVHARGAYVRPHKHLDKSESYHIVEGRLQVVFFEEDGEIRDAVHMGEIREGEVFYYRLSESWYHTVIPQSDVVVFHETTNGPFRREDVVFAPWAPDENDHPAVAAYLENLQTMLGNAT